jgi:hypothetical protein
MVHGRSIDGPLMCCEDQLQQWRRHEREPPRPMNDREQQVRERAYYIWEAEGRPHGRAEIHWTMAEIATAVLSYLSLSEAEGATDMRVGNETE